MTLKHNKSNIDDLIKITYYVPLNINNNIKHLLLLFSNFYYYLPAHNIYPIGIRYTKYIPILYYGVIIIISTYILYICTDYDI